MHNNSFRLAFAMMAMSLAPVRSAPPAEVSPEEQTNIAVYQKGNRSVVNITTRGIQADDFFLMPSPKEGSASGTVLDKSGHVLTNFHVVEEARAVIVTLFDGSTHPAKMVGSDPTNDLAVLKIEAAADKLIPIAWGDSTKLQVGMRVFSIGNPFGLERTLTTGIVSSLNRSLRSENGRMIRGIIQTDAAINPGNSGGPLLNRRGELIGITTAIISRSGQSAGVGLAVPSATAHRVVNELIQHGHLIRADCGIFSVYETDGGLRVGRMLRDGPAQRAGLKGPEVKVHRHGGMIFRSVDRSKADLIVAVDGKPVKVLDDLLACVENKKPGGQIILTIMRDGQKIEVPIELEQARNP